jgi:ABC-type polar amino acid transport system ATPase subunit
MIEARNLVYTYPGSPASALNDVSVEFPRDAISAIVGESGSGKTTLMMCLGRFTRPTRGRALYDDTDVFAIPEHVFRQRLGMVFQKLYLFPHLTVRENMTLAMRRAFGRKRHEADQEAEAMLERLGIAETLDRYPGQISGGQAQRAAIARGLLLRPDYMLLDEPTSALDARTTDSFAEWLRSLKNETNFIVVTHDVLFARRAADRGVCLMNGAIAGEGPIEEALARMQRKPHP